MVRLKASYRLRRKSSLWNFNSTMVRLKVSASWKEKYRICNFNYTMVRLKVWIPVFLSKSVWFQFHYGTIKRVSELLSGQCRYLFQFHYGTIKSSDPLVKFGQFMKFQFHYGTIKRSRTTTIRRRMKNFNSTMVRLKESLTRHPYVAWQTFQFHYGTIKRLRRCSWRTAGSGFQFHYGTIKSSSPAVLIAVIAHFNSTMVRLKDRRLRCSVSFYMISIPLWYD